MSAVVASEHHGALIAAGWRTKHCRTYIRGDLRMSRNVDGGKEWMLFGSGAGNQAAWGDSPADAILARMRDASEVVDNMRRALAGMGVDAP